MKDDAITIQEAAELLNASESFVRNLISEGKPSLQGDQLSRTRVLEYQRIRNSEREAALNEMVALAEEHDLPY